jgi:hypothetical protein
MLRADQAGSEKAVWDIVVAAEREFDHATAMLAYEEYQWLKSYLVEAKTLRDFAELARAQDHQGRKSMNGDYAVKEWGAGEWAVVDTAVDANASNYYGLVAYGFESEQSARDWITLVKAFPQQMAWNPRAEPRR